jgi:hypothetical protein
LIIRTLLSLFLLGASTLAYAQTPSNDAEHFLRKVTTQDSDAAFDQLFAGSGFAESKPQDLVTLKSQTKMAMGLYGTPLGLEKIWEEDLSPSLKRLVYLQKFEKYPVVWEFYFYKPKDRWVINTLKFQDQVSPLVGAKK